MAALGRPFRGTPSTFGLVMLGCIAVAALVGGLIRLAMMPALPANGGDFIATQNLTDWHDTVVRTEDAGGGCLKDTIVTRVENPFHPDNSEMTWTITYLFKKSDASDRPGDVWYYGRGCPQWIATCAAHPGWHVCSDTIKP